MPDIDPPAWLDREAYPFKAKTFDNRGHRLNYLDEGVGEPIVFVHGNPSWSFMYRRQIVDLRDRYRCLALDHLGFGLSEKPPGAGYRPQDHAERFARWMNAVESEPVHLVVHDWGGPIGMSWALQHPGRVRSLLVLNTWFWSLEQSKTARRFSSLLGGFVGRTAIRKLGVFEHRLMRSTFPDKSKYRAVETQYRGPFRSSADREGVAEFPKQVIGASEWLAGLWRQRHVLEDKPISLFWALKDPVFRKDALERWLEAYPEAHLEKLPGIGHYVGEEMGSELTPKITAHLDRVGALSD